MAFNLSYSMYIMYISGMPTVGDSPGSVDEGMPVNLSCHASQFAGLNESMSFGWFRVDGKSEGGVVIDGRVTNSTHGHSGGIFTGRLMFTPANRNDRGSYKCKAFNVHGSSTLSTAVSVDVKCELTDWHYSVSWFQLFVPCVGTSQPSAGEFFSSHLTTILAAGVPTLILLIVTAVLLIVAWKRYCTTFM